MSAKLQTSREYFRSLQIIYYGMIAGPLLFILFIIYLKFSGLFEAQAPEMKDVYIYLVPIFIIGGIVISNLIFKNRIKLAHNLPSLLNKMSDYYSVQIIRLSVLEGTILFSIVVCFITGEFLFLAMGGISMMVFYTLKPSREKAAKDLELDLMDINTINDPDKVIAEIKVK